MATFDMTIVPATVTITNTSNRVKGVQLYRTNTSIALAAGDILKLNVTNSNELVYFQSLASDELTVAAVAVE